MILANKNILDNVFYSIGNLLENVVYKNQTDLKSVIFYLEQSFQKHLLDKILKRNEQFVEALKTWDIIVRFAQVHNCVLPDILLKYLANHDLWFEFVAVSHVFAYPTNQVRCKIMLYIILIKIKSINLIARVLGTGKRPII